MSRIPEILPDRYISTNGRKISKSRTFKDLYIVETENGWFSIASSDSIMQKTNPPKNYGKEKEKE